jgi:hypothetical protein
MSTFVRVRVDSHYTARHDTTRQNILVRFPHARIHTSRWPTGSDTDRQRQCRLDSKKRISCLSVPVVAWYCEPLPGRRHDSTEQVAGTFTSSVYVFSNTFYKLTMDTDKLIELVREHSELYDLSNSKYSDNVHKEWIWEEIAEEMKHNGKLHFIWLVSRQSKYTWFNLISSFT